MSLGIFYFTCLLLNRLTINKLLDFMYSFIDLVYALHAHLVILIVQVKLT